MPNKDMTWNDCLLCSSLWGTCAKASLCGEKVKGGDDVDGTCVSCKTSNEVGCGLYSAATESECSGAAVQKTVTCAAGYIPFARFCKDDSSFCYVVCQRNRNRKMLVIVCAASIVVLMLFVLVAIFR